MMPFAPSRPLFGVPSVSSMAWSTAAGSANDVPTRASASSPLTCPTAVSTPFPPYRDLSPSRSSTASRDPVDAPEGTPARAVVPSARVTVTARVGPPRESRISTACTADSSSDVLVMMISLVGSGRAGEGDDHRRVSRVSADQIPPNDADCSVGIALPVGCRRVGGVNVKSHGRRTLPRAPASPTARPGSIPPLRKCSNPKARSLHEARRGEPGKAPVMQGIRQTRWPGLPGCARPVRSESCGPVVTAGSTVRQPIAGALLAAVRARC